MITQKKFTAIRRFFPQGCSKDVGAWVPTSLVAEKYIYLVKSPTFCCLSSGRKKSPGVNMNIYLGGCRFVTSQMVEGGKWFRRLKYVNMSVYHHRHFKIVISVRWYGDVFLDSHCCYKKLTPIFLSYQHFNFWLA